MRVCASVCGCVHGETETNSKLSVPCVAVVVAGKVKVKSRRGGSVSVQGWSLLFDSLSLCG